MVATLTLVPCAVQDQADVGSMAPISLAGSILRAQQNNRNSDKASGSRCLSQSLENRGRCRAAGPGVRADFLLAVRPDRERKTHPEQVQ